MAVLAFEDMRAVRPAAMVLSEREKAMLFDLALAAGAREASCREALAAAPLIEAFARAYVAIRDREDGLI